MCVDIGLSVIQGAFVTSNRRSAANQFRWAVRLAILALAFAASPAGAQQSAGPEQGGASLSGLAPRATISGEAPTGIEPGASIDDTPAAPDLPPDIPSDDPSSDPIDPLFDDAVRPGPGQRRVIEDGDISQPEASALLRDGVIDVGEPAGVQDGIDPLVIDTRDEDDRALFQNPPSGFDPLLFQIEDIDPLVTDRRTRRLFDREPYDPIGIRIGSFIYFPQTEVAGAGTSNILRQSQADSDVAAELRTRSRLVSNWSRHAVEFGATSDTTFHNAFPDEDERAWSVEGRGRLDIAKRTNLQGLISHDVRQEGRSAIDANETGDRTEVTTERADLALNHRFNRLSVQLRGGIDDIDYGATDSGTGTRITNDDRDTRVTTEAVRASWEFKPTFSVFGEVETNQRRYDVAALSDGLRRDSDGERYRVGVDFGETGEILRGEVSIGYGEQDPKSAGLSTVEGILIDANVAWRLSDPTTLLFTARTDLYDTNTTGSAGVVSRQVGIEARHAFRRHIVATAGLTYTDQAYDGVDIDESELRAALGLEYYVNREWVLFGRYEHIDYESSEPDGDWKSDDVRLGVRWRR